MKRTKREENSIIIHFIFYFVLTVALIIFGIYSILPQIKQIEDNKNITRDIYNNIVRIEKKWLDFTEFKSLNNSLDKNRIITEILKNIDKQFYDTNLVNNTFANYKIFLDNKKDILNNEENKLIVKNKSLQITKLLPSYSDNSIDFWWNVLTNYKFINYVESIIESFNLSTNSSIGISRAVLLDDFSIKNTSWQSLDSNIFYIPLSLKLTWTKSGIVDFLYFIENVWNISVQNNDIKLNTDDSFLFKNWIKKILEWSRNSDSYNIFENQIIDIDNIHMKDYIDSSYFSRSNVDLKDFIKNTQANNEFEITVNLLFYVKWQPVYKIEEFIMQVLDKYRKMQWFINISLKKTDLNWIKRINLTKFNNTLKQLNKEVVSVRKEFKKKDQLESVYKKVIQIDKTIDPIFKKLEKDYDL